MAPRFIFDASEAPRGNFTDPFEAGILCALIGVGSRAFCFHPA
jgi:hypothetical protein